jgi:hypothetical protein
MEGVNPILPIQKVDRGSTRVSIKTVALIGKLTGFFIFF